MDATTTVARHVFVTGRVQGVSFRWATRDRAVALGLSGWVRNLADGRVEAWIEGSADGVASLEAWLAGGPTLARVDDLELRPAAPAGVTGFEIRPTAR